MIVIKTEFIPVKFICVNEEKMELNAMLRTLEDFSEGDVYKGYELLDKNIVKSLVKEGFLQEYIGKKQSILYRKTDRFDEFYEEVLKLLD